MGSSTQLTGLCSGYDNLLFEHLHLLILSNFWMALSHVNGTAYVVNGDVARRRFCGGVGAVNRLMIWLSNLA